MLASRLSRARPVPSVRQMPRAAQIRQTTVTWHEPPVRQFVAGKKRMIGKPHPKAAYDRLTNEPIVNEKRLMEVFKWTPEQVDRLRKHMKRIRRMVTGPLSDEDVRAELQGLLNQYIEGLWGTIQKERREASKKRRRKRLKRRAILKQQRKMERWQRWEDFKEQKVIRDKERERRKANNEQFAIRRFLRFWSSTKKEPYVIHDEETFQKKVVEYFNKHFFKGPVSARRPRVGNENYETRFDYEIWDPLMYELKRKAKLTELIQQREDAIREKRALEELERSREERRQKKEQARAERLAFFNKVYGQWHEENQRLIQYKRDYILRRNAILDEARNEFLTAMNDDILLWKETPDECKLMRFMFGKGVTFPFRKNKAPYH